MKFCLEDIFSSCELKKTVLVSIEHDNKEFVYDEDFNYSLVI